MIGDSKSPKRTVSGETLKMKFMQRKKAETISSPSASEVAPSLMSSPTCEQSATSAKKETKQAHADPVSQKDFKWRLPVCLPKQSKPSEDELDCSLALVDVNSHPLCRRSFHGFNLAVERAYEDARGDPEVMSKRAKRLEQEAIGDEEMANFYANRVKTQQQASGKGKGGGKGAGKGPQRISGGGGGGGGGGAAAQKRKRR